MATAEPVEPVPVAATDPLYVLYTSGTTGTPKGIVRDNGGHAVALLWSMRHIYDMHPGDVFWAASDVGWVVGHSYIVYGPLLLGATTVLYEGKPVGTPDPGAFWRVAAEHQREGPLHGADGDPGDPEGRPGRRAPRSIRPVRAEVSLPRRGAAGPRHLPLGVAEAGHSSRRSLVADRDGVGDRRQPDGGGGAAVQSGSPTVPMPGYDVHILHADGDPCEPGEEGVVCLETAVAAGHVADAVGRRRPLSGVLSVRAPRLLPHR